MRVTAKEYLRSIQELDRSINAKQRVLDGLERDKGRLRSVCYDGARVQSSGHSDPTSVIDRIDKLQREINSDIDRLVRLKADARIRIAKVYNRTFISLLTDVYINGLTLWKAAESMNVSYETIKGWHGQALQIFRKENDMT